MIYIDFVDLAYFFQYSHKPETLLLQTVKYSTSSKELNTARIYFLQFFCLYHSSSVEVLPKLPAVSILVLWYYGVIPPET